jgi:hypothetical protein
MIIIASGVVLIDATVVKERIASEEEWSAALNSAGGPETIPWLIALLQTQDGILDRRHLQLCQKYAWARRWLPKTRIGRFHTARFNGARMLARLAPGTEFENKAVTALLSLERRSDKNERQYFFHSLSLFTNCANVVVPELLTGITNPATFDASVDALRRFGTAAAPALYQMALPETGFIRPAELALEKIAPAAYRTLREEKENAAR